MSYPRTDRPVKPLILYRAAAAAPTGVSAWTEELESAAHRGATWWVQVAPERLLAYVAARREWLVDVRGLTVEKLDERSAAGQTAKAAAGVWREPGVAHG